MIDSKLIINLFLLCILLPYNFFSQTKNVEKYQFISPVPGSSFHLPETNIIIRHGDFIIESTLDMQILQVVGFESGLHKGELILSTDQKTLIFKPFIPFEAGERVKVTLNKGISTQSGVDLEPFTFIFKISGQVLTSNYKNLCSEFTTKNYESIHPCNSNFDSPVNYPQFTVTVSNNPMPDFIFITPHYLANTLAYLMIMDNNGIPIYYKKYNTTVTEFKKQFNGLLTFYDHSSLKFIEMDSSYKAVDNYKCGNGYNTDGHDLLVLQNGHSFLMSYDPQTVRMDTIVAGGDPQAVVYGLVIQELDANKNVIFQWRSWDHFQITDATYDIDLTQHVIDYVHGNSIEVDYDNNLLISSRNMDEITKIDRQTGDILWRFGGLYSKNNQFQFIGDPVTFSHQHDVRRIANGNITLFDNGSLHTPPVSRSLEYQLDEINKIAVLVWKYNNNPTTFEPTRGSSRRLDNHNTIIGWGDHLQPKSISEVRADGTTALEIIFPDSFLNYRTYKYPWRTNLLLVNPDSIFFESVSIGDSSTIDVLLQNNSSQELNVTGFYNKNNIYTVNNSLPINVVPFGSEEISISFRPEEEGYFKDQLYIFSDTDTSRIAQVLFMGGRTDTIFSSVNYKDILGEFLLEQNYPNPFNPTTNIKFRIAELGFVSLKVYDVLGNKITTLINEEKPAGTYEVEFDGTALPSGIYFYTLSSGNFFTTKKMILLK